MNNAPDTDGESPTGREAQYNHFVALIARHDQAIRRFVRSLLPSREGVDDVVQETALECWKKFSDFSPACSEDADNEFARWACVIARFKVLSWQRDRSRDRLVFREGVIEALAEAAMDSLDQQESQLQAVENCLHAMPDDQRRLILSVHSPGESIAMIAAETGEKARRLYSRINVLRSLLLDCVQQRLARDTAHG